MAKGNKLQRKDLTEYQAPYQLTEWFDKTFPDGADVCEVLRRSTAADPYFSIWLSMRFLPLKSVVGIGLACARHTYGGKEKYARHLFKRLDGWLKRSLTATEDHIRELGEKLHQIYSDTHAPKIMLQLEMLVNLAEAPFEDNHSAQTHPVEHALHSGARSAALLTGARAFCLDYSGKQYTEVMREYAKLAAPFWTSTVIKKKRLTSDNPGAIVPAENDHGHTTSRPLPAPRPERSGEHQPGEIVVACEPGSPVGPE